MAAPLLQEHPPPLGPSRIARLAPTTAQLVRSAAVVPSLPRILAELVQNSIDASANSISCTVDLDTWTIKCDDNGRGFTALDLDCLARAQRYSTSKVTLAHIDNGQQGVPSPVGASPSSYYGSRGEALVSLQYVATVEIRTRALHDPVARELVLRQGMCLAHGDCAIERPNHGASVVVRDIFHNVSPEFKGAWSRQKSRPRVFGALMRFMCAPRRLTAPRPTPRAREARCAQFARLVSPRHSRFARLDPSSHRLLLAGQDLLFIHQHGGDQDSLECPSEPDWTRQCKVAATLGPDGGRKGERV
jgi:hypothetical protein